MEMIGRLWGRIVQAWLAFSNAFANTVEEVAFRVGLAFDVLVGRVPIRTDKRPWVRSAETPILVDVYDWTTDRLIFSVLCWPPLESDMGDAYQDHRERVEEVMTTFAEGAGRKSWSTYWEVDHGLVWDHRRECWQDGDGHRYDGSRFGAGSRTPGIVREAS